MGSQLTFNNSYTILYAVVSVIGNAYGPEAWCSGALERVLGDWPPPCDGYFLYYSSRSQIIIGFQIVVDVLRHRRTELTSNLGRNGNDRFWRI